MLQLYSRHDFYNNFYNKTLITYGPPPTKNPRCPPVPSSFSEAPRQTQPSYSMGKLAGVKLTIHLHLAPLCGVTPPFPHTPLWGYQL